MQERQSKDGCKEFKLQFLSEPDQHQVSLRLISHCNSQHRHQTMTVRPMRNYIALHDLHSAWSWKGSLHGRGVALVHSRSQVHRQPLVAAAQAHGGVRLLEAAGRRLARHPYIHLGIPYPKRLQRHLLNKLSCHLIDMYGFQMMTMMIPATRWVAMMSKCPSCAQ